MRQLAHNKFAQPRMRRPTYNDTYSLAQIVTERKLLYKYDYFLFF